MKSFTAKVIDPVGIHARPASELVQIASKFKSDININANGKSVNAKSIITIMSAGIKCGDDMTIEANGDDEADAITAIEAKLKESKII